MEEKEGLDHYSEDSGESGSESKESESIELPPAFEITNSGLQYIRAVGNSQKTTAIKRAAPMSLV